VLNSDMFDASVVSELISTERVNLLLIKPTTNPELFSPDIPTPFNLGDGLSHLNIPFPVALLSVEDIAILEKRIIENVERGYGDNNWQHGAEFTFYNGKTSVTSQFCLERGRCDPLGGLSVWGAVGDVVRGEKESVLVTTQMDSTAFFHDLAFGANSAASGIIAVLGAVHALGQYRDEIAALDKQIMVALFQAEVWDRTGSRRFVHDIVNGCASSDSETCSDPFTSSLEWTRLNLSKIGEIVAVDQVAGYFENISTFFTHIADDSGSSSTDLESDLQNEAGLAGLGVAKGAGLPPSALTSFLENEQFIGGGVVFSGYNATYQEINPFYRSRFDRAGSTNVTAQLTNVATAIARTAFVRASKGATPPITASDIEADFETIRQLESCLTQDFACDLVAEYLNTTTEFLQTVLQSEVSTNKFPPGTVPALFYTGVFSPQLFESNGKIQTFVPPSVLEIFVRNFVSHNTKPIQDEIDSTCGFDNTCVSDYADQIACNDTFVTALACVRGRCICSSTHFHDAYSPGLALGAEKLNDGIAISWNIEDDTNNPIWTEPTYSLPTIKLYQDGGYNTATEMLISGLILSIFSYVSISVIIRRLKETKFKLD